MELGGLGNTEKVTSSGLPDRLQRAIGDKKHKKLLGSAAKVPFTCSGVGT